MAHTPAAATVRPCTRPCANRVPRWPASMRAQRERSPSHPLAGLVHWTACAPHSMAQVVALPPAAAHSADSGGPGRRRSEPKKQWREPGRRAAPKPRRRPRPGWSQPRRPCVPSASGSASGSWCNEHPKVTGKNTAKHISRVSAIKSVTQSPSSSLILIVPQQLERVEERRLLAIGFVAGVHVRRIALALRSALGVIAARARGAT